ncbi:MAG: putative monooxygenase [Myxococcales bacterium]|nr:putative monooxygenase [Myxococcales bacterium]
MKRLAATFILLAGCTSQSTATTDPSVVPGEALTYYQDTAPIFAARCVACHSPGNIAPFSLETYGDAMKYASLIKPAIANKLMPPMPPDTSNGCPQIDDERVMPDAERDQLIKWVDGGSQAGDAAHPAPMPNVVNALGAPAAVYDSGLDYASSFAGRDEYRCFVIDPALTSTFNLVAVGVKSTNPAIVHHTIVYAQLPAQKAAVDQLDAADPLPGYECFGGPNFANAITLGASAVGSEPKPFPNGSGAPVPAGTRYVVQVHYNFDNARGSNRITVEAWSAATLTQIPHGIGTSNYTFKIPAGAVGVQATAMAQFTTTPLAGNQGKPGLLWSAFPHMHQIGSAIRVDLVRANGQRSCVIDIPKWDFHWQGSYQFKQPIQVAAGDQLLTTCTWDNSAAHQPLIDGVPQTPKDITFGEGSTDEMCLAGFTLTDF